MVQCLKLHTSKAGESSLIPHWGTKIFTYCNVWHGQKIKLKKFLNMFLSLKKKGRNRKELPQPDKGHL